MISWYFRSLIVGLTQTPYAKLPCTVSQLSLPFLLAKTCHFPAANFWILPPGTFRAPKSPPQFNISATTEESRHSLIRIIVRFQSWLAPLKTSRWFQLGEESTPCKSKSHVSSLSPKNKPTCLSLWRDLLRWHNSRTSLAAIMITLPLLRLDDFKCPNIIHHGHSGSRQAG